MALVDTVRLPQPGWLRSREFDLALICGLTAMALAAGGLIAMAPAAIVFIMLFDTWVLGSPHVIATLVPARTRRGRIEAASLPDFRAALASCSPRDRHRTERRDRACRHDLFLLAVVSHAPPELGRGPALPPAFVRAGGRSPVVRRRPVHAGRAVGPAASSDDGARVFHLSVAADHRSACARLVRRRRRPDRRRRPRVVVRDALPRVDCRRAAGGPHAFLGQPFRHLHRRLRRDG